MKDSNGIPHSTYLRNRIRFDDNISVANNTTAGVISLPLDTTNRHNSEETSSIDSEHSNGDNVACDTPPTTPSKLNDVVSPSMTECRRRRTTSGSNADDVMRKKNRVKINDLHRISGYEKISRYPNISRKTFNTEDEQK